MGPPLVLAGELKFDMVYNENNGQQIISPGKDTKFQGERIIDSYNIEITFDERHASFLPQVREIGGKIGRVAEERNLPLEDLHINSASDGSACLCFELEEKDHLPNGFELPTFFCRLVVPFFYGQTFFKKYNRWPWGDYSHGDLGAWEWYESQKEKPTRDRVIKCIELLKKYRKWNLYRKLLLRKSVMKGHNPCLCGSGKKIRNCHPKILQGLWRFQEDIRLLSLKI